MCKNKKVYVVIVLFYMIFHFVGCGIHSAEPKEEPLVIEKIVLQDIDWTSVSLCLDEDIKTQNPLSVEKYIPLEVEDTYSMSTKCYAEGSCFYTYSVSNEDDKTTHLLDCIDVNDISSESRELFQGQEQWQHAALIDLWLKDNHVSALMYSVAVEEDKFSILQSADNGEFFELSDVTQVYKEKWIVTHKYQLAGECILDTQGNSYTRTPDEKGLCVVNNAGELIYYKEYEDYSSRIGEPIQEGDSPLIFPVFEGSEKVRLVHYNLEEKTEQTLVILEEDIVKFHAIRGQFIYYETPNGLVQWDFVNGSRNQILNFVDLGITDERQLYLAFDQEGNIYLRNRTTQEDGIYVLTSTVIERDEVRVVSLCGSNDLVKGTGAAVTRRNPEYLYTYEEAKAGEEDAFQDRILAEVISGKGPDILYLSGDDMQKLWEKGALVDLEEFISSKTKEELLAGVVEMGTIEKCFVGVAPEVYVNTLLISDETWEADTWTLSDFLKIVEENEDLKGIFTYQVGAADTTVLLDSLVLKDLEHSPFIDWKMNESNFENEEFVKVLEIVKKFGTMPQGSAEERTEMVINREYLGRLNQVMDLGFYSSSLVELGNNFHYVGFPTENGNGNYLRSAGLLVVNKNTVNKEAVACYLEYLLSEEGQDNFGTWISPRRNTIEVYYDSEGNAYWENVKLDMKEDGSTYVEDFEEFLNACVPLQRNHEAIRVIVSEEADVYFNSEQTAEETAKIIDSRVQLYLDEQK